MTEPTLQQQLAVALQQLSKQHDKQLQSVLEQVQSLSNQVIALTDTRKSDSQNSNQSDHSKRLSKLMSAAKQHNPNAQCLECKHAHWRSDSDFRKVEFNCLNNMRIEQPVQACSQFEIL
jgi:hypothetical protein